MSPQKTFTIAKESDLPLIEVDFWMVLNLKDIDLSPEDLMNALKDQFESVNIVKVQQTFYFEHSKKGSIFL